MADVTDLVRRFVPYIYFYVFAVTLVSYPGGNPGANLKSISYRYYLFKIVFVWALT